MKLLIKIALIAIGVMMLLSGFGGFAGLIYIIIGCLIKTKKAPAPGSDPDAEARRRLRKKSKSDLKKEIRREERELLDLKATIAGRSEVYHILDAADRIELKALQHECRLREEKLNRMRAQYRKM